MAKKTNCTINGIDYYRIRKTDGLKYNAKKGIWEENRVSFYGESKSDAEQQVKEHFENKARYSQSDYFGRLAEFLF